MVRRFSIDFALLSIVVDAGLTLIALVLAGYFRPLLNLLPYVQNSPGIQEFPLFVYPIFPVVWVLCFLAFSIYSPTRQLRPDQEFLSQIMASFLAVVTLAGVLYFTHRDFSRAVFLSFAVISFSFAVGWRWLERFLSRVGANRFTRPQRVLVVGAGIVGLEIQQKILAQSGRRPAFVGFLDDDPGKRRDNPQVLDTLDHARAVVLNHAVDHVILALPRRAHDRVTQLVTTLHDLPVRVYIIPDYFALSLHHAAVEEFAGIPMLDLRAPALSDSQRLVKRAFDLLVTLLFLPVAVPVMGCIALAVRFDLGEPALFLQERVGENGRVFRMLKFRTMIKNAEALRHLVEQADEHGNLIHKSADDPRVTRLGRFLRSTSLDELPQLFNILTGEMSLVGPRPEMPYLVEKYQPWQRKRFAVPPGLTGWWQVHGRSDKPMHLHTEEDLYYIQNYSPWLDLFILLKTIGVVISRRGAY